MDTKKEKVTCTTCKLIQADLSGDVYYMQTRFQQIWIFSRFGHIGVAQIKLQQLKTQIKLKYYFNLKAANSLLYYALSH